MPAKRRRNRIVHDRKVAQGRSGPARAPTGELERCAPVLFDANARDSGRRNGGQEGLLGLDGLRPLLGGDVQRHETYQGERQDYVAPR